MQDPFTWQILVMTKGDKPLTARDLSINCKLHSIWHNFGPWKIIALGYGYYEFLFKTAAKTRDQLGQLCTYNLKSGFRISTLIHNVSLKLKLWWVFTIGLGSIGALVFCLK
jgi:hypothetical protein